MNFSSAMEVRLLASSWPNNRSPLICVDLPPVPAVASVNAAGMRTLADSDPLCRLVAVIRSGAVTVLLGGHLQLPDGYCWPICDGASGPAPSVLYVPNCFAPLWESVLDHCKRAGPGVYEDDQRRIVTGQDGIGKTGFV